MTVTQFRKVCQTAALDPRTVGAIIYREAVSPSTQRRVEAAAKAEGVRVDPDLFADRDDAKGGTE